MYFAFFGLADNYKEVKDFTSDGRFLLFCVVLMCKQLVINHINKRHFHQ